MVIGGHGGHGGGSDGDSAGIHCSGTLGSFNNYYKNGSQDFTDAKINSGENSGQNPSQRNTAKASGSAAVRCSGTEFSFNNHGEGPQKFKGAKIYSGQNSGLNLTQLSKSKRKSHRYGTESSCNCDGNSSQCFELITITSGKNSGEDGKGGSKAGASGVTGTRDSYNYGSSSASGSGSTKSLNSYCNGTQSSFNCHGNVPPRHEGAKIINSCGNPGHHGGSGSAAGASKRQGGVSGTRDSFNNYGSSSNSKRFTNAEINSGENSGSK